MPKLSEQELVAKLKAKDREGFEYLYDNYSSALFGILLRIVRSEQLAEELLQDVFLKIWNNISEYDTKKSRLFTWMLTIARNLAIDKTRTAEYKHLVQSDNIYDYVYLEERDNALYKEVEYIGLKDILNHLPEQQRKLIDLMYFQGYSQSDISEELNLPLGTVKTRVRAAMNTLRKLLQSKNQN
ncbi:MAG: sigma-70 family RNA polymerase sigma factor [Cytophagaceae bacterium]|nr:sigma-70 family RNA polymerase sigma factor [Cytophagaceae bacterium]MDW8456846.1 sigma-70 family RNA polymerase sigma factor [Cytophagaceae bacterium]